VQASELAAAIAGELKGGADPDISGVAPLDRAGPSELAFLASAKYLPEALRSGAGVVLVTPEFASELPGTMPHIITSDVHRGLSAILPMLYPEPLFLSGVHPSAVLERGVQLDAEVRIDAGVVIGTRTRIGPGVHIAAQCVIGRDCVLGAGVYLHPHVTLYDGTEVGARSILHSGVRAGADGFGYAWAEGRHVKIPQVGTCRIGSDVEIGANTTIDRGSVGPTEIGDGCKIDNLVHIGHNVRIGPHTVIIAQVGVSGSTRIGRRVTLGGQAGINGHITIGDGATIAGQAGVFGDVPANAVYSGYPARPHREALRVQAALFRLPALMRRLRVARGADSQQIDDPS
jgi:UDP-3-O-[3-hydroxymyristoyl] glucosamine N-acyltransferase